MSNLTLVALNDATRGESVTVRVDGLDPHLGDHDDCEVYGLRRVTLMLIAGEDFYEGSVVYQPIPGLAMVASPRRQEPPPASPD